MAFGDDSQFRNILAYAVIIIPRSRLRQAERKIRELKQRHGIPAEVPLHCRVLFGRDQRAKASIAHLSEDDARSIVSQAVTIINQVNGLLRYATDCLSSVHERIGQQIELTHESDGSKLSLPVNPDPKGFLGMLMQACLNVPPGGKYGPSLRECEVFLSEDPTMVKFIGPRRTRADGLYAGFSDLDAPPDTVFQLQPNLLKTGNAPLLQLVDIAAYICSHAADLSEECTFFRKQLSRVEKWASCESVLKPA
jgi:hypothetical protein